MIELAHKPAHETPMSEQQREGIELGIAQARAALVGDGPWDTCKNCRRALFLLMKSQQRHLRLIALEAPRIMLVNERDLQAKHEQCLVDHPKHQDTPMKRTCPNGV